MSNNDQSPVVFVRFAAGAKEAPILAFSLVDNFDPEETSVATFEESDGRWSVELCFRTPPDEAAVRAVVARAVGPQWADALAFERVATRDWAVRSRAGLDPVRAGRFVVHGSHDRRRVPVNAIGIEIEAALAFGTGHHGTTSGCLLALDRLLKASRPRKILDIGTGSGVLAIAAARALRRRVLASDNDIQAVRIARDNARLNRAGPATAFLHAAGADVYAIRRHAPFGLVLANILLAPLQRLARPLARLTAPGAQIVLSGLLRGQDRAVLPPYRAQGFALMHRILLDGWVTLVLQRHTRGAHGAMRAHRVAPARRRP